MRKVVKKIRKQPCLSDSTVRPDQVPATLEDQEFVSFMHVMHACHELMSCHVMSCHPFMYACMNAWMHACHELMSCHSCHVIQSCMHA